MIEVYSPLGIWHVFIYSIMIIKLRNVYRKFLNSEWTLYRQWFAGVSRAILHMDDFIPVKQLSQRETIEPKTNLKLYMVTSVLAPNTNYHYL